ncbi:MAG: glycerol kinase GlpK [Clostridiales bacterium]|uniref:glycerol kinase GlpK n=1 Tax=Evtepia sp. TaxID=2773933 RepID=UPI002983F13B|nr:glycerol kinase GlpK [Evtepia sp.]MDD7289182.1 glycerol kinase GlpK [Clostridiales bacterium]MDY4431353.1 glycerol kinase GlpK [Evtepia sp.]
MKDYLLALDQGTTSSRAILFTRGGAVVSSAQIPFPQHYPKPGWVEHDPMELLTSQLQAAAQCVEKSGVRPGDIAAVGLANQRETAVVWERKTGRPVGNAIVWQCRRTADFCTQLQQEGYGEAIREKTGLVVDAYFSGTKYQWILDHVPGARARAERGELLCGTVDSWLLWNLTGGKVHASDYSNCCRTMLFDIHRLTWDEDLCRLMKVPMDWLPQPVPNSGDLGTIAPGVPYLENLAGLPIRGAAGDQQAALFGQGCFAPGQLKNTYGTGCFTLMNTGKAVRSQNGLLTCIGWGLGGETTYVLEGSVFNAGSSIQWLRDELGLIQISHEVDILAESVPDNGGVYLVSAFTGLGAPHWDMYARGTILGLTRGTTKGHLCRATLEGIAYQTADLIAAMEKDAGQKITGLRVDGGASVSDFMMQYQADLLDVPVERPEVVETTAWGAACLAGLGAGVWKDKEELLRDRKPGKVYLPQTDRSREYAKWKKALERAKAWEE